MDEKTFPLEQLFPGLGEIRFPPTPKPGPFTRSMARQDREATRREQEKFALPEHVMESLENIREARIDQPLSSLELSSVEDVLEEFLKQRSVQNYVDDPEFVRIVVAAAKKAQALGV